MDFRYTSDELEVLNYARTAFRAHLPLTRLRDSVDESVSAWAGLGTDGWTHVCLTDPDTGPNVAVLAGLAREAGAVAAGEEFVQNGWIIPRLCAAIDDSSAASDWLAAQQHTPGFLVDAGSDLTPGAHRGFDRYVRVSHADGYLLQRHRGGQLDITGLAGLSRSTNRTTFSGGETLTAALRMTADDMAFIDTVARLLRAAALVGVATEILDRTVTYVGERHQFGRPIGQFQAVKHLCADLHTELQVAWLAVLYGTVCFHTDPTAVDQGTNQAAQVGLTAARTGAQLHGGMGFTWESDLHWLLKSVLDSTLTVGDPGDSAAAIGERILETA